jgi:hypothetical protein
MNHTVGPAKNVVIEAAPQDAAANDTFSPEFQQSLLADQNAPTQLEHGVAPEQTPQTPVEEIPHLPWPNPMPPKYDDPLFITCIYFICSFIYLIYLFVIVIISVLIFLFI